ncbi:MAG: sigma-54-dependent Fis family transcriptional regulator [Candidatus Hydrogenedentes bacterium]|nr:sigma-54-dependent Fis family transcriptional regulator [Candidatus Hydrogenedentota bacterium]
MEPSYTILIADDQEDVLDALRLLLRNEPFILDAFTRPDEVRAAVAGKDYDLVLIDLNYHRDTTSGREGIALLDDLLQQQPAMPVVVMTAWGSVEVAVEAMKRGARDFIQKPWDNARLRAILHTQLQLASVLRQRDRLSQTTQLLQEASAMPLLAQSPALRQIQELIRQVGPSSANVLITGENGTGKGVVARALHQASERSEAPMITVNAGGLSESLFESELFGHVKGAFTDAREDRAGRFELADGGTLFLDEIANLSMKMQARLLRVLETGEFERVGSSRTRRVNTRILAATNANLHAAVEAGEFRRDLFFRLNTVHIDVPPLRDRPEDIPHLAEHFLSRHVQRYRKPPLHFSVAALEHLLAYSWPGNVRELDHAVERAVLLVAGDTIDVPGLRLPGNNAGRPDLESLSLEEVERLLIEKALRRHEGNVSRAAKALGLSRSGLYRRMEKYAL